MADARDCTESMPGRASGCFEQFDSNNDGALTPQEFLSLLTSMNFQTKRGSMLTIEDAKAMIDSIDSGNGEELRREAYIAWRNNRKTDSLRSPNYDEHTCSRVSQSLDAGCTQNCKHPERTLVSSDDIPANQPGSCDPKATPCFVPPNDSQENDGGAWREVSALNASDGMPKNEPGHCDPKSTPYFVITNDSGNDDGGTRWEFASPEVLKRLPHELHQPCKSTSHQLSRMSIN